MRGVLTLVLALNLSGCAAYSAASLGVGLATGQTITDRAVGAVADADCGFLQPVQGLWYCERKPRYNQEGI